MLKEAPLRPLEEQLRLLVLHIRSGRQGLLIVAVPDADAEWTLAEETRRWLGDEASVEEVRLESEPIERLSLSHHLSTLPPPSRPAAVFVFGLDDLPADARTTAINAMNWGRERLRQAGYTVVLWVRPGTPGELGNRAPDFFSWRSDVFEFALPADLTEREQAVARLRLFAGADLGELGRRYREYVIDACRWLDFRGVLQVRNIVRLPLDDVFVAPDLTTAGDDSRLTIPHAGVAPERLDAKVRLMGAIVRRLPLGAAVREAQHLVLLGDPGSGKSTALRFLALTYARGRARVRERLGIEEDRLPILVPLSAFADARIHGEAALEAFLPAYFKAQGLPDLSALFATALAGGRALLLLDGLDEILEARGRADVSRAIADFLVAHPDVRVLVSSRIAGFQEGLLPAAFSVFTIAPLDNDSIEQFAAHWSRAFEAAGLEPTASLSEDAARRAQRRAESLVAAATSHHGVRRLAGNPLMLTLLALVHQQGTRLPSRRADLYRLCVEALAETWNLARSLSGRPIDLRLGERRLDEDFVVRFLAPVAYWMHETQPTGMISADQLIARIAEEFTIQQDAERQEAEQLARDFVNLAREQMGLLVERAPETFAFVHLTIQEYLAARFLSERHDAFGRIRSRLHDPRWAEVVRLTAGTLRGDHAAAFVEHIISAHIPREKIAQRLPTLSRQGKATSEARTVPRDNRRRRELVRTLLSLLDVRLGADCIAEEVTVSPALRRWTTQFVIDRWIENTLGRHSWQPALVKLGRDVARREVEAEIQRALSDRSVDEDLRADAARAQGEINPRPEIARTLLNVLTTPGEPTSLRRGAAQGLARMARSDGELRTELREILRDTTRDASVRALAAQVLGGVGRLTDSDIRVLLRMLGDRRLGETIRKEAASALGRVSPEHASAAAAALLAVIRDPSDDPTVRVASALAARHLPDIAAKAAFELLEWLENRGADPGERFEALFALRFAAPHQRLRDALLNIVRTADEEPALRGEAAELLADTAAGDPDVRSVLVALAGDKRAPAEVRHGVAYALRQVATYDQSAIAILINLVRDEDLLVRLAALLSCAGLWRHGDEIVRTLFDVVDDEILYGAVLLMLFGILSEGGLPEVERVTGPVDGEETEKRSPHGDQR